MKTERVRTTISLTPEALDVFKRMADAGNMSVSRCMGDWLVDTADAAEMITVKMEDAKKAPLRVMRELRAMVAGMSDELDIATQEVRDLKKCHVSRASGARGASEGAGPPSSNTGVLVPPVPMSEPTQRSPKAGRKV